jgi:hypothetical protein
VVHIWLTLVKGFSFPLLISKILILVLVVVFLKKSRNQFQSGFEKKIKLRTQFWFQFQFQKSNPISIWFLQTKTTNDGSHLSNYPTPI